MVGHHDLSLGSVMAHSLQRCRTMLLHCLSSNNLRWGWNMISWFVENIVVVRGEFRKIVVARVPLRWNW